jgi:hypothetical protein
MRFTRQRLGLISFIEGFMKFIDDYMKHLTQAKFGVKKAFHVMTRLAKGMWIPLAEPRNGVMKMFKMEISRRLDRLFFGRIYGC